MLRVGIIGCGRIAQRRHAPEYAADPDVEIVGYYDRRADRARALADVFGGRLYTSVEELLADPSIDAVSVCVANNAHAEVTIAALRAGKHVLCEKPMATNIEDCLRMIEAAKETGKYLMIGQNQRVNRGHIKAKELIKSGAIGKVLSFKTTFGHGGPEFWCADEGTKDIWFFDKNVASMGAMADLGIHKTDLIQFLLDDRITEVTARLFTADKRDSRGELIDLEDNGMCIYKMASGVFGTMAVSWTYYGEEDNSTKIYGTKGYMTIYDHPEFTLEIITPEGDKIYYDIDHMMTNTNQRESGVIREFVRDIRESRGPSVSGESVLNAMKAVFACFESNETGRTVVIE